MADSENLMDTTDTPKVEKYRHRRSHDDEPPDDLASLLLAIFRMVNFKLAVFIFMLFIFLNTSSFIDSVLVGFNDAVDGRQPTERGIVIQGVILTTAYILLSLMVEAELI